MDQKQMNATGAQVDEIVAEVLKKAADISERQAKVIANIKDEWEALYLSVPEGRLRTISEIVAVRASFQSAEQRLNDCDSEIARFKALSGQSDPAMHPALPGDLLLPAA